jgi:hypothetical protein
LTDNEYAPLARNEIEKTLWQDVKTWDARYHTHKVSVDDRFEFDDVKIHVLRVFNPDITNNCINNSSTV